MSTLGLYLKKSRNEAGISQREVSDKLGHSTPQYLSNVERGVCLLAPKHFKTIAKLYNIESQKILNFYIKDTIENTKKEAGIK